jgi:hypothetical protein
VSNESAVRNPFAFAVLCFALAQCSGAERLRADASAARRCAEEIDDSPSAEDSDDEFLYNWCVENGVP